MFVERLVGVEHGDVSAGRGRRHVEGRLLDAAAAVEGAGEGADGAGDDDELVHLQVAETILLV